MNSTESYSFQRYLQAKKSLDDRSLNHAVSQLFIGLCRRRGRLRVLELGCGTGAMLQRLLDWGALTHGEYLGIDLELDNITHAKMHLPDWGKAHGYQVARDADHLTFYSQAYPDQSGSSLEIGLQHQDAVQYSQRQENFHTWDVLVVHAFLDLFPLPQVVPAFLRLLKPGGLFYFTLNFDGLTSLEPVMNPVFDHQVIELYHRSMDQRQVAGKPSGDSLSGRHLLSYLPRWGASILAAGASDWVVFPGEQGYEQDEAYFLHHILLFFEQTLVGHPEIDPRQFSDWLAARHAQVERAELVYIAHQVDILGKA